MSEPPPVDPALNRRLVAERLGWPDGALEACSALEADYPAWHVFWTRGGLPRSPERGFRAIHEERNRRTELYAPTAEDLRAQVAARV
jgi:hypothetical protein